jgi:hypothetical protein
MKNSNMANPSQASPFSSSQRLKLDPKAPEFVPGALWHPIRNLPDPETPQFWHKASFDCVQNSGLDPGASLSVPKIVFHSFLEYLVFNLAHDVTSYDRRRQIDEN